MDDMAIWGSYDACRLGGKFTNKEINYRLCLSSKQYSSELVFTQRTHIHSLHNKGEVHGLSQASKEVIWFHSFLGEFGFKQKENTHMFSNNQGCLSLIKNLIHHSRTKHIDIQHHYVKEMVSVRSIRFEYVPIAKMVVDILTKVVPTEKNTFWCMEMLGV